MLPNLGALDPRVQREAPTGEFIRLSRAEARKLNNEGIREPINKTMYMPSDCNSAEEEMLNKMQKGHDDEYECFEPFKVWVRDPTTGRPGRKFHIYNAQALWVALRSMEQMRDPCYRQPFWREDWYALHERYDPNGGVPRAVRTLPRKDKHEGYDTEEEEDDPYSDEEFDMHEVGALVQAELEAANQPSAVWGRFWLKGVVPEEQRNIMESLYFREHLKAHIPFLFIGRGITVDDISSYRFSVHPTLNATPASLDALPGFDGSTMPVTCVDFQLLFNRYAKAVIFTDWVDDFMDQTTWDTLAGVMFGISALFVGQPYTVLPEIEDPESTRGDFYGGAPPRVPVIDRSHYNDANHWTRAPAR